MTCTNCEKEVYVSTKYCEHCGKNLKNNILTKNDNSFNLHLQNWKFYIAPIILGVLAGFLTHEIANIKGFGALITFLSIIIAVKYKSTFIKRLGMFIISNIILGLIYTVTLYLSTMILEITYGKSNNQIIASILLENNNLPKMINNELEQMPYFQDKQNEINGNYRFINYSKEKILSNFNYNISLFEKQMLQNELKTSCIEDGVQSMLSNGLKFNINYYSKNTKLIGIIFLNEERCKPYY